MSGEDIEMQAFNSEEVDSENSGLAHLREKSSTVTRAAYRAELANKRGVLLALLIIPVLLIIAAWHLFDSNAHIGVKSHRPLAQLVPYTLPVLQP